MKTHVRDSSIDTYYQRQALGINDEQRDKIAAYIKSQKWVTRKMIAKALNLEASTVSGQVNALIHKDHILIETEGRAPCPVTGVRVHWVQHKDNAAGQVDMFGGVQ